ncbi:hypothetical protein [Streptomyces sp. NPDC015414]|uniref:hypothetical protein n=1 Tax=Streptomyces sp. NPDC015414 TaxID=3364957 RepID=UPI0036F6182B
MARNSDAAAGAEGYPAEGDVTGAGRRPDEQRRVGERLTDEPARGESVHRPEGGAGLLRGEAGGGREGLTGDDRVPRDGAEAHPGTTAAGTAGAAGTGAAGIGRTGPGTPGTGTPATGTPGRGTVEAGTPVMDTSKAGTPAMGTTEAGTPAMGTTEAGTPAMGTTEAGTPAMGTTKAGTPAMGTTKAGTPAMGTTKAGTPAMGTTKAGTPAMDTTEAGTPGTGAAEGAGVAGRREFGTGTRGEGALGASGAGDDRTTGDRHAAPAPGGIAGDDAATGGGLTAGTGHSGAVTPRTDDTGRSRSEGRDSDGHAPLLAAEEAEKWEAQLRQTLAGFVEEPRSAVEEADRTLEEIAARFGEAVNRRRRTLRTSWQNGEENVPGHGTDTEQLRLALRDYRELADRLLHL